MVGLEWEILDKTSGSNDMAREGVIMFGSVIRGREMSCRLGQTRSYTQYQHNNIENVLGRVDLLE
jgi:hypothetical protein